MLVLIQQNRTATHKKKHKDTTHHYMVAAHDEKDDNQNYQGRQHEGKRSVLATFVGLAILAEQPEVAGAAAAAMIMWLFLSLC